MSRSGLPTVLVTGANGFIGRALCSHLARGGFQVRRGVRSAGDAQGPGDWAVHGDIGPHTDWAPHLRGVSVVVHLAGRAHILAGEGAAALERFREVNVHGTAGLRKAAAAAGARRLVFVSTIGVNGDESGPAPFSERDEPRPRGAYALSKLEAERLLQAGRASSGMEIVIVRPPLVYGPGNPGNLLRLMRLVASRIPLPFAGIASRRSLVGVDNLCELLRLCAVHPDAAGQTFLAADAEDLSLPQIVAALASGMGRPARLWRCPQRLLQGLFQVVGRAEDFRKLCAPLQVDASRARQRLGWHPAEGARDGLRRTGEWFAKRAVAA